MSISETLQQYTNQLKVSDENIQSFFENITAIDIIKDSNLQIPKTNLSSDTSVSKLLGNDKFSEQNLSKLTLSQLSDKKVIADSSLSELNKLWFIKGLIQEIEMSFNPIDAEDYKCDKYELESILSNLKKLSLKVSQFENTYLIRNALNDELVTLNRKFNNQLLNIGTKFYTEPQNGGESKEYTSYSVIIINDIDITASEFRTIVDDFIEYSSIIDLKQFINGLKFKWEKNILNPFTRKRKYINLDTSNSSNSLSLVDGFKGDDFFCEYYFKSIMNFVKFINSLNDQQFKNYYSNKISNNMMNTISENILKLYNNDILLEQLNDVLKLTQQTHWPLSITKSFSSSEKVKEQLDGLYNEWVINKYINEIRLWFDSEEFGTSLTTLSYQENDAIKPQNTQTSDMNNVDDGWNESWDNDDENFEGNQQDLEEENKDKTKEIEEKEEEDEEEDAWDDGWDDNWGNDEESEAYIKPKKPVEPIENSNEKESSTNVSHTIKVSKVPEKLATILNAYGKETEGKSSNEVLTTAILALCLISYPSLEESFLLYNDLKYLGLKLNSSKLDLSAESNWSQQTIRYSNELFKILLPLDITGDNDESNIVNPTILKQWFQTLQASQLRNTNVDKFKTLIIQLIEVINNWFINTIINLNEIMEFQSNKFTRFIKDIQQLTNENLEVIGERVTSIKSANKLRQTSYLLNNHLKDIMDYFYQGELYDYKTDELVKIIQSIFIKSDLRDNYIKEIVEIRSMEI